MAWIELHQSLWTHKKTFILAAELGIDETLAGGHLARLWTWALDNAPDGCLEGLPPQVIAFGAGWKGDAVLFVDALIAAGWVDVDPVPCLHDWHAYAGRLIERREANAQRARTSRARREHVAPLPNRTVPNLTSASSEAQPPPLLSEVPKKPKPATAVTDDYLKEIQPRHPTVDVREVFADASNRKVWDGYKNQRRALSKYIGWAEEKAAERRNHATNRNGHRPGAQSQFAGAGDSPRPGRAPDLVG